MDLIKIMTCALVVLFVVLMEIQESTGLYRPRIPIRPRRPAIQSNYYRQPSYSSRRSPYGGSRRTTSRSRSRDRPRYGGDGPSFGDIPSFGDNNGGSENDDNYECDEFTYDRIRYYKCLQDTSGDHF
eukprot:TRINITY_DN14399_c1_g1_i2.p1 TRINITY_DN14399_c1_g1~~TRINITY_DN14399_c1_g1_i2.p1  ORF type:complete len:137 (-),score=9.45 TRINITY_DN14399_c1_g1_i2:44-424(-)